MFTFWFQLNHRLVSFVDSLIIIITILLVPFQWCDLYIESDITIVGRKLSLTNFRHQLEQMRHKAGLILPIWKAIWIGLCLYLFIPTYFSDYQICTKIEQDTGKYSYYITQLWCVYNVFKCNLPLYRLKTLFYSLSYILH